MQFLENFMLAHPFLLSTEWDHIVGVLQNLFLASLFIFPALYDFLHTQSGLLLHEKYIRVSFTTYALYFLIQAYGSWHYPGIKDPIYPLVQMPLLIVGFLLLLVSGYCDFRHRQAAKNQSDAPSKTR